MLKSRKRQHGRCKAPRRCKAPKPEALTARVLLARLAADDDPLVAGWAARFPSAKDRAKA